MNLFTKTLSKIFKSGNQQELTKIKPLIAAINEKEASEPSALATQFKWLERSMASRESLNETEPVAPLGSASNPADAVPISNPAEPVAPQGSVSKPDEAVSFSARV